MNINLVLEAGDKMTSEIATTSTTSTGSGGFAGDPAEAFAPPSAGSCCGSTPTVQSDAEPAAGCCGTDKAAAGGCCG
ncbi:hypothetical protein [Kribbella sp. CA-293567]|uniref:hypothetical protein n=1 Tax=Kribbella sp. CA-293567 TaxID=3002436 RepID=UPI0022DDD3FE|nr:hypothetical protein [Kribbella sp. CA-293567]WBQ05125.1 hypothetical protein OX958_34905 [Kribbella sp. CA-293567]